MNCHPKFTKALGCLVLLVVSAVTLFAQDVSVPKPLPIPDVPGVAGPDKTKAGEDKRVFGVLPNYRTAEMSAASKPLTPGRKFHIAIKDSFDYPLFGLSAIFSGLYQLEDNHPQFGQGFKGYAKRYGTAYADQVIGNMLTEGVMPALFREDPRYFRMSSGKFSHRLFYAVTRVLVTRTDSGHESFNFAEVVGNGMAAGIGLSYYEDNRNFHDFAQNASVSIATDAISQIGKEFWPDIKRHYFKKHLRQAEAANSAAHQ